MDWDKKYIENDTPWDKGSFFPSLPYLLETFPKVFAKQKRVFVPGCGMGHDAVFLQVNGMITVAADISETAIELAKLRSNKVIWRHMDIFFPPPENMLRIFNLVWEHTCFCAIPLEKRADYVAAMSRLLDTGGYLAGVFFTNTGISLAEGPPFYSTREEVIKTFSTHFTLEWEAIPPESYEGREDRELLMLWKKR